MHHRTLYYLLACMHVCIFTVALFLFLVSATIRCCITFCLLPTWKKILADLVSSICITFCHTITKTQVNKKSKNLNSTLLVRSKFKTYALYPLQTLNVGLVTKEAHITLREDCLIVVFGVWCLVLIFLVTTTKAY